MEHVSLLMLSGGEGLRRVCSWKWLRRVYDVVLAVVAWDLDRQLGVGRVLASGPCHNVRHLVVDFSRLENLLVFGGIVSCWWRKC